MEHPDTAMNFQPHALCAADFRLHALDINPDLRGSIQQSTIATPAPGKCCDEVEPQSGSDLTHWILIDAHYRGILGDLAASVRAVQRLANFDDTRSDPELFADLLTIMGLWDCPKPLGQWGNARFMTKFLVAFSRLYLHVKVQEGGLNRRRRPLADAKGL